MALSKELRKVFETRAQTDPDYCKHLLSGGASELLGGDIGTAKSLIRTAIHGTIGFVGLAERLGRSPKSLMRSFGPNGNPTAKTVISVVHVLSEYLEIRLSVSVQPTENDAA